MKKKCFSLEEELIHKQQLIDRLNKVIDLQTKKLKASLHNYI